MKYAKVDFWGRRSGAIGIRYMITAVAKGEDDKEIILALYKKFDPYLSFNLQPITEEAYNEHQKLYPDNACP